MRPYRPPTFADGIPVPGVIAELGADLGVTVYIRYVVADDEREIIVDGEPIASVGRYRNEEGRSVYHTIDADEFRTTVREAVKRRSAIGPADRDPRGM